MQLRSACCCRNCFVLSSSCCEAFMRGILSWLLVFLLLPLLLLELLQQLTQPARSQMHCGLVPVTALHVQPQSNPEPANQTASSRRSCCRASFARGRGDSENRHSILQKRRPCVALHDRSEVEFSLTDRLLLLRRLHNQSAEIRARTKLKPCDSAIALAPASCALRDAAHQDHRLRSGRRRSEPWADLAGSVETSPLSCAQEA